MRTGVERWQDWAIFAVGLWLAVSPWLMGYASHPAATANAAVAGLGLALLGHFQASCELLTEWLHLAAGAWLLLAPFVLGFDGVPLAAANAIAVGAAVAALAASALELDRGLRKRFLGVSHGIRR